MPSRSIWGSLHLTLLGVVLLLAAPARGVGQEGTIAYTHSVRLEVELPPGVRARMETARRNRPGMGAFPDRRTDDVVLIFDGERSLMRTVPSERRRPDRRPPADDARTQRLRGFMQRLRTRSTARRDREMILTAYVDFGTDSVVEVRQFLGRKFRIPGTRPALEWKLTGEQARFLDYTVMKATARRDSSTIEAWFTPEIPVSGGPESYGGLPGMILVLTIDDGRVQYSATQVSLTPVAEGVLDPPEEGEEVSRQEYEKIVKEKLEELRRVG